MIKKILVSTTMGLALLFGVVIYGGVVKAADFNLTPTTSYVQTGSVKKNGGAAYENCFYVTPTYFSKTGAVKFRSVQNNDTSVNTPYISVSSGGVNVTRSAYYGKEAESGYNYKMRAVITTTPPTSINVRGRWTP